MELREAVRRAFRAASRPGRLGVEVELIPVTHVDPPRAVDPAWLAVGFDADFVSAARPTFEPGGQLELSPPPRWSVAEVVADVDRLLARATAIARARGIRLEAVGTNPYQSCADIPLRTPTPRYLAMQDEFDRVGSDGRRMMRLTASLQISVDLLPGAAGVEQWLVANLAGPALTVAFANSMAIDGRPTAVPGARTRIWLGVDHRRTAYDGRHLDLADPIGAYAAFAAAAPRLRIPASADPAYHLSTLFPPVRPRGGYLELRYLDAQPPQRFGAALATVAHLLYDRQARRDALDLLRPTAGNLEQAWISAGAGHASDAAELLSIGAAGGPAEMLVAGGASWIAFVAGALESLDPSIDTTVGLMHAAQDRGADVWVTEAQQLEAVGGRARALARLVRLAPSKPAEGPFWTVDDTWFTVLATQRIWLDEMAAVFMRTDPPLDGAFVTATLILDLVDASRTAMVNDPRGLRACSEHLLPLRYPDLIPPTIVTSDLHAIRSFLIQHGTAVVKPVDGFAGRGVLRLDRHDPNLPSLLEMSTDAGRRSVVVQRFLRKVADGNKRVFVIDGQPVGAVFRYPAAGDFRIGNPTAEAPITARDREICAHLAPVLHTNGIRLAGLDVIGPHLIEVNVTSVGALRKADALLGWTLCADLLHNVLSTAE